MGEEHNLEAKVYDKTTCFQISRFVYPLKVNKAELIGHLPDDVFDSWLQIKTIDSYGFQLYSPDREYVWCVPFRFIQSLRKIS